MNYIIFIGFKGVGKSTVGRAVAKKLGRPFYDLDDEIEKRVSATCREIFAKHGEKFFRELEHQTLKNLLKTISQSHKSSKFVLAVGGGAVLLKKNQQLLKALQSQHSAFILHITAPPQVVLKRIMAQGRPVFFPAKLSDQEAFQKVWKKRMPVYESIANETFENNGDEFFLPKSLKILLH